MLIQAIVGLRSVSSSSQLGALREGPCHVLIDRAIAIAEGSGLLSLDSPTIKQARAAAFLLQTAHGEFSHIRKLKTLCIPRTLSYWRDESPKHR